MGEKQIDHGDGQLQSGSQAVLALVFAEDQRPDIDSLRALSDDADPTTHFSISHVPAIEPGWAELLTHGLTFDCIGLAPGNGAAMPPSGALLGLEAQPQGTALSLQPGPHLEGGRGLLPVIRAIAGLGAELARLEGVLAACWLPARTWMAPTFFRKIVSDWLGGGAFPALGLTSLQRDSSGAMISVGLGLITGQELRFEPRSGLHPASIARITVRLMHLLVEQGPLSAAHDFTGPEGERLQVTPIRQGRELRISLLK